MSKRKKIIKDKKLRGEWAESVFMERATQHGLPVSKPWGEMCPYDFVIGKTGRFVSVQVKSTISPLSTGYVCTVQGGHKPYPAGSFDFLAAYVVVEDVWYIIPAGLTLGKKRLTLYPKSPTAKYEQYREAWNLLREAAATREPESCEEDSAAGEVVAGGPVVVENVRRFPNSALERMEAAFNFAKRQMERGGAIPKRDEI